MKLYLKIVVYVVVFFTFYGFFLPDLISAPSTIDLAFGILLGIISIPITYYYFKWVINTEINN